MSNEKQKLFRKILRKKFGDYIARFVLQIHKKNGGINKFIEFGEKHGLEMEQIVLVAVNYCIPPKVTITFDLLGSFNDDADVQNAVLNLARLMQERMDMPINKIEIDSIFPILSTTLHFDGGCDELIEEEDDDHNHEHNEDNNDNDSWDKFIKAYENS